MWTSYIANNLTGSVLRLCVVERTKFSKTVSIHAVSLWRVECGVCLREIHRWPIVREYDEVLKRQIKSNLKTRGVVELKRSNESTAGIRTSFGDISGELCIKNVGKVEAINETLQVVRV